MSWFVGAMENGRITERQRLNLSRPPPARADGAVALFDGHRKARDQLGDFIEMPKILHLDGPREPRLDVAAHRDDREILEQQPSIRAIYVPVGGSAQVDIAVKPWIAAIDVDPVKLKTPTYEFTADLLGVRSEEGAVHGSGGGPGARARREPASGA